VKSKKLKLSVTKCTFFAHKVEFCGREIHFHDGKLQLDFAARFYQSLLDIGVPTTASELAQAIYMCNWLSPALYNLAAIIYPFRLMLDSIHKARGTKKNRGLVGTSLATFGWSAEHTAAWKTLLNSIVSRVKCTTYDPGKELCLFTDASNTHFAAVITQCTSESLSPPFNNQTHEPLFFLSGTFKGAQLNYHVSSKEAWPILWAFTRLDWLFQGHPTSIHVFCDHRNLETILHPSGEQVTNKATLGRLYRWALRLAEIQYTIFAFSRDSIYDPPHPRPSERRS